MSSKRVVYLLSHIRKSQVDEILGVFTNRELAEAVARRFTPEATFAQTYPSEWVATFGNEHHWEIHEFRLDDWLDKSVRV